MLRDVLSLFRRVPDDATVARELRREIESREQFAQDAPLDRQGLLFNRAGDFCFKQGEYAKALRNFGHAIDAYLQLGHLDAAPALCQKVIRVAPEVVRARSTLASISLAEGLFRDAQHQIADYVEAANAAAQQRLASERLRLMAAATENNDIRMLMGEYLLELGDPAAADDVFGMVFAERNGLRPPLSSEVEERWGRLLPVALMGPREIIEMDHAYPL